jgi:hypothetical protein
MFQGHNFNNAPDNYTDDDVIAAYLLAWSGQGDASHSWASPELDDLVRDEPERAWQIIRRLCEKSPDEQFESILAAGPVEDLLSQHGPAFIERVEQEAAANPRFNHLLGGVWRLDMSDEIWQRVQSARRDTW